MLKSAPVATSIVKTARTARIMLITPATGAPSLNLVRVEEVADATGTVIATNASSTINEPVTVTGARPCAAALLTALQGAKSFADVVAAIDVFTDELATAVQAEQASAAAAAAATRAARLKLAATPPTVAPAPAAVTKA